MPVISNTLIYKQNAPWYTRRRGFKGPLLSWWGLKQKFGLSRPNSAPNQVISSSIWWKLVKNNPRQVWSPWGWYFGIFWHLKTFGAIWVTLIRGNFGYPFFIQIRQGLNFFTLTQHYMYPITCVKQRNNPNRTT